jgi:outer membrane protein assembly factor BamB
MLIVGVLLTAGLVAIHATESKLPASTASGLTRPSAPLGAYSNQSSNSSDWTTYLGNPERTGTSAAPPLFSPENAGELTLLWRFQTGGLVAASTTVANGTAFVGSWDGYEYALNVSRGTEMWQTYLGINRGPSGCAGPHGVTSSATVVGTTVYVGGGDSNLYALNAATGSVEWKTYVGNRTIPIGGYLRDSPLVYRGNAYIGLANICDPPTDVQGQLFQVNTTTHAIVHVFNTTRPGHTGAGIWGSPTVIPSLNTIYFTTGNGPANQPYQQSILAVNASTLALVGHWEIPLNSNQSLVDGDFGSTPTYFTNAAGRPFVLVENKNGIAYAFNATDLGAGPVWMDYIAIPGNCPECGQGSIAPAAFDGAHLYVAGGMTSVNGTPVAGSVRAVNTTTGQVLWSQGAPGYVLGGLAYSNGLVFDGANATFEVRSATNGTVLYRFVTNAPIATAISLAEGHIFVGSEDHSLYAFGFGAPRWAEQFNPPPMTGAAGVMDGKDGYIVTMGGCSKDGCPNADTWRYANGAWTNLTPDSLTEVDSPSARTNASMSYDAGAGDVLLFGGMGPAGVALNDTWTFSAGKWTQVSTSQAPSPRAGATLTYLGNGASLLFGGYRIGPHGTVELGDTWLYEGGAWTNLSPSLSLSPGPRDSARSAGGGVAGTALLFGGRFGPAVLGDTWMFAAGAWTAVTTPGPEPRYAGGLVYNPTSGAWLLTGGIGASGHALGSTWLFSSGNWTNVSATAGTGPGARSNFVAAFYGPGAYSLVFGGSKANGQLANDSWKFANGAWTSLSREFPGPGRYLASSAYDAVDNEVVLFGGQTSSGSVVSSTTAFANYFYSSPCIGCVPGVTSPSARYGGAMAYDSTDREVVLFGGWSASGKVLGDTWTFVKGRWTNVTPAVENSSNSPSPRAGAAMANDPSIGGVLLFGGTTGGGAVSLNDTWRFHGGVWSNLALASEPPARSFAAMSWDTESGSVILFGGNGTAGALGDTWSFDAGRWSPLSTGSNPSARAFAELADDPALGGVLLYGGSSASGAILGDVWLLVRGSWILFSIPGGPAPREGAVWSFDASNDQLLLFGGRSLHLGKLAIASDTWFLGAGL